MKTQNLKNSETVKSSNLMILVTMIIFCQILLFTNGSGESKKSANNVISPDFVLPAREVAISKSVHQELEKEKLLMAVKLREATIRNETNSVCKVEFSMAKMNEYLIPEEEPEMDANIAKSIVFPETESFSMVTENELSNINFLRELKSQAFEKTKEAVEFYALEKKVREYLTIENEKPLEIEDWMINKKCWWPELRESVSFAEKK